MHRIPVAVVLLSKSFSDIWEQLAADAGTSDCQLLAGDEQAVPTNVAAVILAAGGVEFEVLPWLDKHELRTGTPVFVVGADTERRTATQIVGHGAKDYFALPEDLEVLRNSLAAAVQHRRQNTRVSDDDEMTVRHDAFNHLVGTSAALRSALAPAEKIVRHKDATVLITGETGTGKELLAHAIHDAGPRRGKSFIPINCSALPEKLIESELFGHEKGAFTGADAAKPGLFEVADGGTLFLDEIGTVPLELQSKLLRVLQDKTVRRVGGTKSRTVDVRITAATNEELKKSMQAGTFREDLYYRLSVITLSLPPLRDRDADVLAIAEHALDRLTRQHRLRKPRITAEFKKRLLAYHWPGNVRELLNAVERALLLSPSGRLDPNELAIDPDDEQSIKGMIPFVGGLDEMNAMAARTMIKLCAGNRSEAARRLAISRRRLRRLLDPDAAEGQDGSDTEGDPEALAR